MLKKGVERELKRKSVEASVTKSTEQVSKGEIVEEG